MFRRFSLFFLGFSIGMIVLAFFFKGKGVDICYLPNCRVLKDLRSKPMSVRNGVDEKVVNDIKGVFYQGNIDFSKSNTKSEPCKKYFIKGVNAQGKNVEVEVENCKKECVVLGVKVLN